MHRFRQIRFGLLAIALSSLSTPAGLSALDCLGGICRFCVGETCVGVLEVVSPVPPSPSTVLEFEFDLDLFEAILGPQSRMSILQVRDAAGEIVLELAVASDLISQKYLELTYQATSGEFSALFLGPTSPTLETLRVERRIRPPGDFGGAKGVITVQRDSDPPYTTGTVSLSGSPSEVAQGNLEFSGNGEGEMGMSPVSFD